MESTCKSSYDGIADVYEKWCAGDPAYGVCHDYYIQYLKDIAGTLVELGIGTGRIALNLVQQYGKNVIGIDESAQMLKIARRKYETAPYMGSLTLQHGNFLDLDLPYQVECIYMPFRTIGHITETEDVIQMFRLIHRHLKTDGVFLFDHYVFNQIWAQGHDRVRIPMYEDAWIRIEDYYRYDFQRQRMDCSIYVNNIEVSRFEFAYCDVGYYQKLLEMTGFVVEHLYGSYDRSELRANSTEQIYVCRKKARFGTEACDSGGCSK